MARAEFAHYYGDWIWGPELTDWVKSLLLFFDGIAIGMPEANAQRLIDSDPVLAQPLVEMGLLRNFWPEVSAKLGDEPPVDPAFKRYMKRLDEIYDQNGGLSKSALEELVTSVNPELRAALEGFAQRLALAKQNFGGEVTSRANTLAVAGVSGSLVQYVTDVSIQPVIDNESAAGYVATVLGSHGRDPASIIVDDIRHVGIDLQRVPLDEVLHFRREHGSEYRAYSQDVRRFVLQLSLMSEAERSSALAERHGELEDRAEELRRVGRNSFKHQAVSFGFGFAGAAWIMVHGDAWGALFAAGAAAAGLSAPTLGPIGAAYSYIFQAKSKLAR